MPRRKYTEEQRKKKREIALKNLEKANKKRQEKKAEEYKKGLEKDVDELHKLATKAMDDLPKAVQDNVKQVIEHELTQKDFSKYLAHDMFKAYTEVGGRELLKKHIKKDPVRFMQFLNTMVTLLKQTEDPTKGQGRVQVNIMGLDPDKGSVSIKGE